MSNARSDFLNSCSANPSAANVCAVVVAYYPDATFEARLQTILPQVARLVIVDNTPEPVSLSEDFYGFWQERLHRIVNAENKGIAAALNQGMEYADLASFPWVLTLDQDTVCHHDMVEILGRVYASCSPAPVVIGSNYFDPSNQRCKVGQAGPDLWLEQKTVITSGCLVNVAVALTIKGFRADYFIDQVDHEFCLRARAHGYRVVISRKATMNHSVGLSGGARLPLLGVLPNHSPVRKYYIARNTVVTVAAFWRLEPGWCFRRSVMLFLGLIEMATIERQRRSKVHAFIRGIADGFCTRMGACRVKSILQKDQK